MKTLNLIRSAAIFLILFAATGARADEPPKPTTAPSDRDAIPAKLKATTSAPAPIPKDTSDARMIAGTWRAEKTYMNGKEVTGPLADNVFTFHEKGTLTWTFRGKRSFDYTFTIDPKQRPKSLTQRSKTNGSEFRCIYDIDGDKLKLAIVNRNAEIPKLIEGGNPDVTLYVLKRVPPAPPGKLPKLPGKAPVFGIVTKVDKVSETFSFFLLFDEVVNTEKTVEDEKGIAKKRITDRVMTSRTEEKTGRPLKGSIVSTGEGKVIPLKQAMEELPGKIVIFCDDFEGLHPIYRKMLAKDTWIIEIEKPKGLRKEDKPTTWERP